MHEQLRAVWKRGSGGAGGGRAAVRGFLRHGALGDNEVAERWFVLLGHSFFYTIHCDSPEFSGALLADIFGAVTASADAANSIEDFFFNSPAESSVVQSHAIHLRATLVSGIEVLLCPETVEEQQTWLDKLQTVGLGVSETETHATTVSNDSELNKISFA
jgi:hypothetical protein